MNTEEIIEMARQAVKFIWDKAQLEEREACARLCEKFTPTDANGECSMAEIIRSRGEI